MGRRSSPSIWARSALGLKPAIDLALAGRRVALASGGDAGVYGMAGLAFRYLEERGRTPDALPVEVIPGVTAASAAAALRAPL